MSIREWLIENYKDFDDREDLINSCLDELMVTRDGIVKQIRQCIRLGKIDSKFGYDNGFVSEELIDSTIKLAKQKQRLQDINRIERKTFRNTTRVENALTEYANELVDLLKENNFSKYTQIHKQSDGDYQGVIQISDTHFNEIVDLPENNYDMDIACARFKAFANKAKMIFTAYGVSKVLICFSGDLMNSDRRVDEALAMASNRSKSTFIAVDILKNFILDINEQFNVGVCCICGNESRINKDFGWTSEVLTDNYDFVIYNILKYIFKDSEGVKFIGSDYGELVVDVNDSKFLILHGNSQKSKNPENLTAASIAKYSTLGIKIDYVIFGHLHSAYISDMFSRCGSLVGGNAYSSRGLNLSSKASQNLYIVGNNGSIDGIKIDLQKYDINDKYEYESFNDNDNFRKSKKINNLVYF